MIIKARQGLAGNVPHLVITASDDASLKKGLSDELFINIELIVEELIEHDPLKLIKCFVIGQEAAYFNVTKSIPLKAMMGYQRITDIKSLDKSEFEGKDPKIMTKEEE